MNDAAFFLFLASLSTAAIEFIIRYTDGPWDAFYNMRVFFGIYTLQNDDGTYADYVDDKFMAKLFACHWCFITWMVVIGSVSLSIYRQNVEYLMYALPIIFLSSILIELVLLIRKYN